MKLRLGFLASHEAGNLKAVLNKIQNKELDACVKVIISNNKNSAVLSFGKKRNIPNFYLNENNTENLDKAILETLKNHGVSLVVLANYFKKIGKETIKAYPNKILNLHPSLLPKYGGKRMYGINIHKAVINSNDTESGVTILLATEEYDQGRILAQQQAPRYKKDTIETLAKRISKIEHILLSQTLINIQKGKIKLGL